jgi:hypothetical protein
MTIARAQMYRQLYQLGGSPTGIATMPMDYGQSLQVNNQGQGQAPLMSQAPNYSSATSITSNPLLNYGQPELGQAGGTPLTMRSGGITRLGYANGDVVNIEDQLMQQVQQPEEQMMQPAQPPLQGMEGQQPDIKDPKQALEIIIQMLIAQGLAPEEARQIALQMVQAVAEGGMEEMGDQRIEARFGGRIGYASGGIGSLVNREGYFLGSIGKAVGSIAKGAGKLVKGAVNAVKKVASSDLGKLALTAAALYYAPYAFGAQSAGLSGYAQAFPSLAGPIGSTQSFLFGTPGADLIAGGEGITTKGIFGIGGNFAPLSGSLLEGGVSSLLPGKGTLLSTAAGALGGALAGGMPQQQPGESDADYQTRVNEYKLLYQQGVSNPTLSITNAPMNLYPNNPFYAQRRANGGRIGYQEGGIGDLIKQTTQQEFFGTPMMANGGYMRQGYFFGGISKAINDIVSKVVSKEATPNTSFTSTKLDELINKGGTNSKSINFQQVKPLYNYTLEDLYNLRKENNDYTYAANGGRMGYAMGAEVPTRQNQAGVTELDYRDTGGFVPPIGIKERADDIPAMLSNNEFVFTANAVRNAGGGDENLGAQRMYKLMKNLEKGGRV